MKKASSEKLEFLQKWMEGMEKCKSLKKNMSLSERKKTIKVSADLAMACSRTETKCWSRALIANIASRDHNSKVLTQHVIGSSSSLCFSLTKPYTSSSSSSSLVRNKRTLLNSSRKIMKRRSRTVRSGAKKKKTAMADSIARKLVQKRREKLKRLVPGGDLMDDDVTLIEETLDYIQSLRSQVQVMRRLLTTSQLMKCS
ncbi:transcription factor IBH1-like 1 [Prosopis cineraria]|uniref:transcription factor IBH1-like 1 n=1 Tax=Prosopis cineraria TaxID=364024 RepID=UPI00240F99BE|nr:transcription factor IBH1-like 1 [Prosopis cineraria]